MKIERIEIFAVRYAMTGYFKFFAGEGPPGRAALLVKMTGEDGTVGWGQSVPIARWSYETPETARVLLEKYYGPALIGHDARDVAGAHALLDAAVGRGFSTGNPITRSGLDLAMHDLVGRSRGESLARMWGLASGGPVELSWTVNVTGLDELEASLQAGREQGFAHYNLKVGPDPAFDRELAKRARAAAPEGFLWADANTGYALEDASEAAKGLADAGVDVLESPLPPNEVAGYRELRRQGALPILMDEGVVSERDVRTFAELGMIDGVAMKHARAGGLASCRAQIEYCEQEGLMWLGSGLTDPDIGFAAAVVLYSAYGLNKPAALNGPPQFLTEDLVSNPIRVAEGKAWPAEGPGLGVEVDEQRVREAVEREQGWLASTR